MTPAQRAIIEDVAARSGLSVDRIVGNRCTRDVARPRHEAIYLMCAAERWTLAQIGRAVNRHHSTVVSAARQHAKRADLPAPSKFGVGLTAARSRVSSILGEGE